MILVIVGPTGVGKTKLSVELAKIYNGEIINGDAMQVYKGLDIGTAKVTKEEMDGIKLHLFDIKEVDEDYSVFDYQKDARLKIEEIKSKGKVPIIVGGSGFYIKAALYDYNFPKENYNHHDYENKTLEELDQLIKNKNINIKYDNHNKKRMIRILEKIDNNIDIENKELKLLYPDTIFIGLTTTRDNLYKRIDDRFKEMIIPLIDEVRPFYEKEIESKALQTGIGYKELYPFFKGEQTLTEVVNVCQKKTRNYAKRQYTWFKNQMNINWFNVDYECFNKTIKEVSKFIDQNR